MGQIWIREVTGGIDARRLPETTAGGVLLRGDDGHITRGGEFEKRYAFVETYDVTGTVGLAADRNSLVVFGHQETVAVPPGVTYQRLQATSTEITLTGINSYDQFAGKVYASATFSDGTTAHFYDGVRVDGWPDGRARVGFDVTSGSESTGARATGQFTITAGSGGGSATITSVTVAAVELLGSTVTWDTDAATTAAAVATEINTSALADYTAEAIGATVIITATDVGTEANGRAVVATPGGDAAVGSTLNMSGGEIDGTSSLDRITIGGVLVLGAPVTWRTSNVETAAAVAQVINSSVTTLDVFATSNGSRVTIAMTDVGTEYDGAVVEVSTTLGFGVSPSTGLAMGGGASADDVYQPGDFVRTIGTKMYSLAGPNYFFSGIARPTTYTPDAVGAGFIDVSTYTSGATDLTAIARYQSNIAIFAADAVQVWYVDPDPSLNRLVQELQNTGTSAPKSVTQFGDNDIFYLDNTGIRSLRARDSSNAAATSDIGNAIDPLVNDVVNSLTEDEVNNAIGLIEPNDKRFWLIIKNVIFVLSYFPGAKVSAWTRYYPGFDVDDAVVFNRRVYLRSGNNIYVYGGLETGRAYDATVARMRTPFLDAETPWKEKTLQALDAAVLGDWEIRTSTDPDRLEAATQVAKIDASTFRDYQIEAKGGFHHISVELRTTGSGVAKFGSLVIHYEGGGDED